MFSEQNLSDNLEKAFIMYLKIAQPKSNKLNNQQYHQFTIIKFLKLAIRMDCENKEPQFLKLCNFYLKTYLYNFLKL